MDESSVHVGATRRRGPSSTINSIYGFLPGHPFLPSELHLHGADTLPIGYARVRGPTTKTNFHSSFRLSPFNRQRYVNYETTHCTFLLLQPKATEVCVPNFSTTSQL